MSKPVIKKTLELSTSTYEPCSVPYPPVVDAAVHDRVRGEEDQQSLRHNPSKVHYIYTQSVDRQTVYTIIQHQYNTIIIIACGRS